MQLYQGFKWNLQLQLLLIHYFCNIVIIYVTIFFPTRLVYEWYKLIELIR